MAGPAAAYVETQYFASGPAAAYVETQYFASGPAAAYVETQYFASLRLHHENGKRQRRM